MSIYFSEGYSKEARNATKAFNLHRYRDNHGKLYEIRRCPTPRGGVYERLVKIQWESASKRLEKLIDDFQDVYNTAMSEIDR